MSLYDWVSPGSWKEWRKEPTAYALRRALTEESLAAIEKAHQRNLDILAEKNGIETKDFTDTIRATEETLERMRHFSAHKDEITEENAATLARNWYGISKRLVGYIPKLEGLMATKSFSQGRADKIDHQLEGGADLSSISGLRFSPVESAHEFPGTLRAEVQAFSDALEGVVFRPKGPSGTGGPAVG